MFSFFSFHEFIGPLPILKINNTTCPYLSKYNFICHNLNPTISWWGTNLPLSTKFARNKRYKAKNVKPDLQPGTSSTTIYLFILTTGTNWLNTIVNICL
jgi:hypothetical protein